MKRVNKIVFTLALFTSFMLLVNSCADLEVENWSAPDREDALSDPSDLMSLLDGGYADLGYVLTTWRNFHIDCWADQGSVTNAWSGFWFFAEEPRNQIPNASTWSDKYNIEMPWNYFNSVVSSANSVILAISEGLEIIDDDDVDHTQKTLAGAYFARGVAQGYIGLFYDKGYVVNEDTDLGALEFSDYSALVDAGLASLDLAKGVAQANTFNWDYWGEAVWTSTEFVQIINSFKARIMAAEPRNATDAASVDWATIKSLCESGIDFDLITPNEAGKFYFWYHDWICYFMGMKAPYLQVDIKIPYFFTKYYPDGVSVADPYPWEYPTDELIILEPCESTDQRLGPAAVVGGDWVQDWTTLYQLGDFVYTPEFGYLRATRGRHLFSNYVFIRYQHDTWPNGNYSSQPMEFMLKWEMDLLRAEAEVQLGNNAAAMAILNDAAGARKVRGMLPDLTDSSTGALMEQIAYETFIELFATGKGLQWHAMRRWDMLKTGTPLHMPVPASELEITGDELYTFGGVPNADGTGTSLGQSAWATDHDGN
jgi:hypothetical protein